MFIAVFTRARNLACPEPISPQFTFHIHVTWVQISSAENSHELATCKWLIPWLVVGISLCCMTDRREIFLCTDTDLNFWSAVSDSLRAGRSGDRIPVEARFSSPAQTDSEAHPASYTMDTGSIPGVKRPGSGGNHPPSSSTEVKKEYSYTSSPLLGLRGLF
jgi:hypothetical protein